MSITLFIIALFGVAILLYVGFVSVGEKVSHHVSYRLIAIVLAIFIWVASDMIQGTDSRQGAATEVPRVLILGE